MQTGAPALPAPVLEVCLTEIPGYAKEILTCLSPWETEEKWRHHSTKTKAPFYPYTEAQDFYQAKEEEEGKEEEEKEEDEEEDEVTGQQSVWWFVWGKLNSHPR